MQFKMMTDIINDVLVELGLVPGSGVQTYTEPQIVAQIEQSFKTIGRLRFWEHLTQNTQHTPDGVSGILTTVPEGLEDISDIEWVRYYPYYKHCNVVPLKGEVYVEGSSPAYERIYYNDVQVAKVLRIYPLSFTTDVMIRARRWPTVDLSTIPIPIDSILLTHKVTENLLAKDGINPFEAQRQSMLFNSRYEMLVSDESSRISYYGNGNNDSFTVA